MTAAGSRFGPRFGPRLVPCLLAAGASQRLGEPKALATIGGVTVLERLSSALGAALPGEPIVVVAGAHFAEIQEAARAGLGRPEIVVLHHEGWSSGRSGSVAAAQAARPGCDLLIAPADVPLVRPQTLRSLVREWRGRGAPARGWLAPCVGSAPGPRFGHPVILGRGLLRDLLPTVGAAGPLRDLRALADPIWGIEVDDPAVLDDLDTPGDLAALRRAWGLRVQGGDVPDEPPARSGRG